MTMALPLPPELIDQIFDSVGHKKDFGTLFTCMTTNSKLSHPAMVTLYKYAKLLHLRITVAADMCLGISLTESMILYLVWQESLIAITKRENCISES